MTKYLQFSLVIKGVGSSVTSDIFYEKLVIFYGSNRLQMSFEIGAAKNLEILQESICVAASS